MTNTNLVNIFANFFSSNITLIAMLSAVKYKISTFDEITLAYLLPRGMLSIATSKNHNRKVIFTDNVRLWVSLLRHYNSITDLHTTRSYTRCLLNKHVVNIQIIMFLEEQ